MQISFSGMKNIGSTCDYSKGKISFDTGRKNSKEDKNIHAGLHVKLDNEGSKDLEEYQKIFGKKLLKNDGILDITVDHYVENPRKKENGIDAVICMINGAHIADHPQNRNALNSILKLSERIQEMKADEFVVSPNFEQSSELYNSFPFFKFVEIDNIKDQDNLSKAVKKSLSPEHNKFCATIMKSNLLIAMMNLNGRNIGS